MDNNNQQLFTKSGGKLLTFFLDDNEYGIQILEAREVIELYKIDRVPRAPVFMKGVINLRGKITPVIDLKMIFGFNASKAGEKKSIIVVDFFDNLTGLIVDNLAGVLTVTKENYEYSPKLGFNTNSDYIEGIVKLENRVISVLAVANILKNTEL